MKTLDDLYHKIAIGRSKNILSKSFTASSVFKSLVRIEQEHHKAIYSSINSTSTTSGGNGIDMAGFLIKPVSDMCNLGCSYCYESADTYEANAAKMNLAELENLTIQILKNSSSTCYFYWHGGEPMLAGLDFYKTAVSLQKKWNRGKKIVNAIQTNGVLLNNEWLNFFQNNNFKISISFDGPKYFHDKYRYYKGRKGSYDNITNAFLLLSKRQIPIHVITVINEFIPNFSDKYFDEISKWKISSFDVHPNFKSPDSYLDPVFYSDIIISLYDLWNQQQSNTIFSPINDFLISIVKGTPEKCYHSGKCTSILAVDGNGDFLSCTRPFNKGLYKFGQLENVRNLEEITTSKAFQRFRLEDLIAVGNALTSGCKWGPVCNNGCPQHRVSNGKADIAGQSVFCTCSDNNIGGYYHIWSHVYQDLVKQTANIPLQK